MKRKIYRSSATVLLGSFFLLGLSGCSPALNFSAWFPSWGQENGYFAARKAGQDLQAFYRLACVYQERNQHQMALEEFKRALQLDPNHAQSYNGMGISYDRLGNYRRALGCYAAALKINPGLDYVHNNMGYSYLLQGEPAQAAAAFQKALALNKTNDRYRNNLGVAYAQMGKVHLALAEFKSAEQEAGIPAPSAAELPENRQAGNQPTEEKASAPARALLDSPPSAPARLKTAAGAPPAPVALLEPEPRVAEKMRSASAHPAFFMPGNHSADAGKPAGPAMEDPPIVRLQAKQLKRQIAGKVNAAAAPLMSTAGSPRDQTLPAFVRKEEVAAQAPQMSVAHEARVEVLSGAGGKGVATWWSNHLRRQGVPVARFTTTGGKCAETKIYYCRGYLQEAYQLARKIPLYQEFEQVAAFEDSSVKIKVVIGRDMRRFTQKDAGRMLVARADI